MKSSQLKEKYLSFFEKYSHKRIESAPLIPEHDPTVLFTTAGMHPLVPFLMGEPHPMGNRVADVQKCIRTGDIDEVGDASHLTFFEMLGNWSFGDYFKKEAIEMSYEFLTKELNIDLSLIAVSVFAGDDDSPFDQEAYDKWIELGIPKERIAKLPKKQNWWGPAGTTGPCGPDTEMFVWVGDKNEVPDSFNDDNDLWIEIWNDVFIQYNKTKDGEYLPLEQKSVDTGMGVERVAMVMQGKTNVYEIDTIKPIFDEIMSLAKISEPNKKELFSLRVITDHVRASTFILGDERGAVPSNIDQGYILRRFIRRAIRHLRLLGVDISKKDILPELAKTVIENFKEDWPILLEKQDHILSELSKEEEKFKRTLERGLREFEKLATRTDTISGKDAFLLFQSYGFPIEMIEELALEHNKHVDTKDFNEEFKTHQELSRVGAEKRFKGGLADDGEATKKLHTATHLLNEALRTVLGEDVKQRGSNITAERLRFDFNFDRKLTPEELKKVEDLVNDKINASLPITKEKMSVKDALDSGAQAEFGAKYPDEVWVYSVGDFSKEICMGPHVENTSELGHFKIKKEQSSAAGIRRIKAVLQ